jgi:hypothetical protein
MEGSSWAACGIRDESEQLHADRELHYAVFRGGDGRGAHMNGTIQVALPATVRFLEQFIGDMESGSQHLSAPARA